MRAPGRTAGCYGIRLYHVVDFWTIQNLILYCPLKFKAIRYTALKRHSVSVSHKMLRPSLKEVEVDGLIIRAEYPGFLPKWNTAYLIPTLEALCAWGEKHRQ